MSGQKKYISSIIMPCYNMATLTGDRLLELDRLFHIRKDFELIIVNNGSSDQTRSILKWWSDNADWRFLVKHKKKNIGFGPAVNEGAKAARGDYLFIISNDVILKGDFISDFISFLDKEDVTDFLCGGRVIDWAAGWNEFPGEVPINYVEGWFLAAKAKVWRQIGGFDPIFAPHDYEDIDLSFRASQQGIQLRQIAAPIKHIGAGTIGFNPERRAITEKHRILFAEKWDLKWAPVR